MRSEVFTELLGRCDWG